jgi:hypothetical protein
MAELLAAVDAFPLVTGRWFRLDGHTRDVA